MRQACCLEPQVSESYPVRMQRRFIHSALLQLFVQENAEDIYAEAKQINEVRTEAEKEFADESEAETENHTEAGSETPESEQ